MPHWLSKNTTWYIYIYIYIYIYTELFVQALEIVVDSWKFNMLLLYILWDDWQIFMISDSNQLLLQELKYTLLKPDCYGWRISKMQSRREDTLEERYAIKLCFKLGENAAETYKMLQTSFGLSCMNRASVCEWHKRFKEKGSLWGMMRGVGGVRRPIHQSWLAKGLGLRLGLLCWGFKWVQEGFSSEEACTLQIESTGISTGIIHQSTTPSLSQAIWPRWASRHFHTLHIV